jgi:hypothetical protein
MRETVKKYFENPEEYKTALKWEQIGLLEGLSLYDKVNLSSYFYQILKLDKSIIDDDISWLYFPCVRRIYKIVSEEPSLIKESLLKRNLKEVQLSIKDIIEYINDNYQKTVDGLSHFENLLDYEAEASSLVCTSYICKLRKIYRDDALLDAYLRNFVIDSIVN